VQKAAVIGGGLLGSKRPAASDPRRRVTVLEAAPQLMIAQLDPDSGAMLKTAMEAMGVKVLCEKITTHIVAENDRITHLLLKDGSRLETDMVVVSAGIRPITDIAVASGLTVDKAIVCDDQMRTSDRDVFAVGEASSTGEDLRRSRPDLGAGQRAGRRDHGQESRVRLPGVEARHQLKVMGWSWRRWADEARVAHRRGHRLSRAEARRLQEAHHPRRKLAGAIPSWAKSTPTPPDAALPGRDAGLRAAGRPALRAGGGAVDAPALDMPESFRSATATA
jgi:hypothetical protein